MVSTRTKSKGVIRGNGTPMDGSIHKKRCPALDLTGTAHSNRTTPRCSHSNASNRPNKVVRVAVVSADSPSPWWATLLSSEERYDKK